MTCICNGVGRIVSAPSAGIQTIETCSCLSDTQRERRLELELQILDKKIADYERGLVHEINA